MAVDGARLAELTERLAPLGDVTSKKMFGGAGFWEAGDMFALLDSESRLFFKVDDASRGEYEAAGSEAFAPPVPAGRAPMTMPYYEVPADVVADDRTFAAWAKKAVAVAHATSKKKPAKKR